ncbi:MAG: hypothetical protein KGZ58_14200 [Ignavibacteriales bacterium]|nr:hypothetical protein [Ignavibacteriales bacterium]
MKHKILKSIFILVILSLQTFAAKEAGVPLRSFKGSTSSTQAAPDAYLFWINNLIMPINAEGVIADVIADGVEGGNFQTTDKGVLFSGGFMLSGYSNGNLWSNGVASASRIQDYKAGRVNSQATDAPGIYVVDRLDVPFGDTWQEWKKAVAMGANYYDGDGNGEYNPDDLNNNGLWDPTEDAPDFLGDRTAWTVYNDAVRPSERRWTNVNPQGIDIQQSMFGFRSAGSIGNILFLRYRIINRGTVADVMDSVYFAVWADADLGGSAGYTDDLVGCDTALNIGFTWNDGDDPTFGVEAPTFMISFFQGPIVFVPGETFIDADADGVYDAGEVALDTAIDVQGQLLGKRVIPGAKNLPLSTFVNYVQSDPTRGDPATHLEARNYMLGGLKDGSKLGPCTDAFGSAHGAIPCTSIDSVYWYSGDPVTDNGWIYDVAADMRQMQNIGPFKLKKDQPVDVVVAYVVGRGSDARNSVAVGKSIVNLSQQVYAANFIGAPTPPLVKPKVRTTDNSIELIWDTKEHFDFTAQDPVFDYDLDFEAYEVTMYNTNSTSLVEAGRTNAKVVGRFDVANNYGDIVQENLESGERTVLLRKGTQMDSTVYSTEKRGRVRLVIDTDPFTSGPIIKGKPYFVSVVAYAMNKRAMKPVKPNVTVGTYYIDGGATVGYTANSASIINGSSGGIRPGVDFNEPFIIGGSVTNVAGGTEGTVTFEEIEKTKITGNEYEISFYKDNVSTTFATYWKIRNIDSNRVEVDSLREDVRSETNAFPVVDGVMFKVIGVDAEIKPAAHTPTSSKWYQDFRSTFSGIYYTGKDVGGTVAIPISPLQSNTMKFDKLRNMEIRFGQSQKAYRYVEQRIKLGNIGPYTKFLYAEGMKDTLGADTLRNFRQGYVDVPFQIWVKDENYNLEYQLSCGFLETDKSRKRRPDGIWNPDTNIIGSDTLSEANTREYLVIFNEPYSSTPKLMFTGGSFNGKTVWADAIGGWTFPVEWDSTLMDSLQKVIAKDSYMGSMYFIGLESKTSDSNFVQAGTLTLPISYPFTPSDIFRVKTNELGKHLSSTDRKKLFDKVNVYPNPLFAYNSIGSYLGNRADEPFVTFSNLPEDVSVKIYTLAGSLIRTLETTDKALGASSPFLEWDLKNEDGLRVASGMYIAIVSSPGIGEKVLKFGVILPQKQIQKY